MTTVNRSAAVALLAAAILPVVNASTGDDTPKLAGTWTWTWKDQLGNTHLHRLEVEGNGPTLSAREVFDDESPVPARDLKFENGTLRFTVVRGERRAEYTGKLPDPDHIQGTVAVTTEGNTASFEWNAERRTPAPK
jgi:hypothetical protein